MSSVNFGSLNNPVKPFVISTKQGKLFVKEVFEHDKDFNKELLHSTAFYLCNFSQTSTNPYIARFFDLPRFIQKKLLKDCFNFQRNLFKKSDGNMTLLVAKDSENQLQASCMTTIMTDICKIKDKQSFYVANVAVDNKYRKNHVGIDMVNKILEASNNQFSDMTLFAENGAVPSYKKAWGLKEFIPETEDQKRLDKFISRSRWDYKKHVIFMHKPLDESSTRWYDRLSDSIKNKPWWKKIF